MRNKFADTFYELGKADPRLCVVVADISPAGSIAKFRNDFPTRFVNTGVSEQIMIGMVAGMAQRGLKPFAYTIATFTLYRPFEMVRDDLCYQNLPVTIVGIGGGVTYSTLGATHHAQEDVATASAIPNMSVIAPCDPAETGGGDALVRQAGGRPGLSQAWQGRRAGLHQTGARPMDLRQAAHAAPGRRRLHRLLRPDHEARDGGRHKFEAAGKRTAVVSVHTPAARP